MYQKCHRHPVLEPSYNTNLLYKDSIPTLLNMSMIYADSTNLSILPRILLSIHRESLLNFLHSLCECHACKRRHWLAALVFDCRRCLQYSTIGLKMCWPTSKSCTACEVDDDVSGTVTRLKLLQRDLHIATADERLSLELWMDGRVLLFEGGKLISSVLRQSGEWQLRYCERGANAKDGV